MEASTLNVEVVLTSDAAKRVDAHRRLMADPAGALPLFSTVLIDLILRGLQATQG